MPLKINIVHLLTEYREKKHTITSVFPEKLKKNKQAFVIKKKLLQTQSRRKFLRTGRVNLQLS